MVADEVRNLASKSDQAAKATKELINSSIMAVSEGSEAVDKVTKALDQTSVSAGHVTEKMAIAVAAVEDQNTAIAQVTEGIDQISSVVQTNSEELSAEANSLKQLVGRFTLAKD